MTDIKIGGTLRITIDIPLGKKNRRRVKVVKRPRRKVKQFYKLQKKGIRVYGIVEDNPHINARQVSNIYYGKSVTDTKYRGIASTLQRLHKRGLVIRNVDRRRDDLRTQYYYSVRKRR